jgi:hypothetical protein
MLFLVYLVIVVKLRNISDVVYKFSEVLRAMLSKEYLRKEIIGPYSISAFNDNPYVVPSLADYGAE